MTIVSPLLLCSLVGWMIRSIGRGSITSRAEPVPEGLTREAWWYAVRAARASTARPTPFVMKDGTRLTFNLPDRFLQLNEEITAQARGQVELPGEVATQGVRDRYLINSLYEEAITSSQMEGASTTRRDAKKCSEKEGSTHSLGADDPQQFPRPRICACSPG